ncbi:ArsR/SmtB family transcription factor [Corynebacterium pacaense]|uniref:ArsR/SmtB family transcription factor n=1 Tax=Corynebacterium pacaense TaxID=1816684 RepID=UPI003CCBFD7E
MSDLQATDPVPTGSSVIESRAALVATANLIRLLDSPIRIHIILSLYERPHYVHELVSVIGNSQPLISQHLKVLKDSGIVSATRNGRQMTYCLSAPPVIDVIRAAHEASSYSQEQQ